MQAGLAFFVVGAGAGLELGAHGVPAVSELAADAVLTAALLFDARSISAMSSPRTCRGSASGIACALVSKPDMELPPPCSQAPSVVRTPGPFSFGSCKY